jgi:hypothetical protein
MPLRQRPLLLRQGSFLFQQGGYMLSKKLKGSPSVFQASHFTATKWNPAEEKARMTNKITKFILNGFQQPSFTKEIYRRLSTMFGHIAEYDIHGFYHVWFTDDAACLKWAENAMKGGVLGFVVGDPAWTWSDVEKALQAWMKENRIVEQIHSIDNSESCTVPAAPPQESQLTLFATE